MKKILITGAAGFIGSNFIKSILDDNDYPQIIAVDNLSRGTLIDGVHNHTKVKFWKMDIRDPEIEKLFENVDIVLHLAGLVSIYDCDKDPEEAIDNNVTGTANVFNCCVKHNIKKCVSAETSAVYENCSLPTSGYCETMSDPTTIYATTKAALSNLAKSYSRTRGLNYTLLRFFNVYGQLQDWARTVPPASAGFGIRMMQGKKPIIFGDATRRRDFIHVDDVNAFLKIALSDDRTDNETYNLGTGKSISLIEMMEKIADVVGYKYDGFIQMDEINGEAWNIYADITKAKMLGWRPKIDFVNGHTRLLNYLRNLYNEGVFPKDFMDHLDISSVKIGK